MTREEAIFELKKAIDNNAIEDVNEAYSYMLALEMAIEALEQEPKTVIYSGDGYADGEMVYDMAECPSCGYSYEYGDKDWKEPFCPHCGQPLKWESEGEE